MRRPEPRPPAPRPVPRRRVDLTYHPGAGDFAIPRPVVESRQVSDRPSREPALRDRILPRHRPAPGIFRLTAQGPMYDGRLIRWRSDGKWHYRGLGGTFSARIHPDGSLSFLDHSSIGLPNRFRPRFGAPLKDPSSPNSHPGGGVVSVTILRFDLTDAVMRRIKQDPYGAEKARFASATRRWRLTLRAKYKAKVLRRALARYRLTGPTCRRYVALDTAGRRQMRHTLFLRWDETEETESGRAIRGAILRLVRTCGMDFSPRELRAWNAKRGSRARFAP